ncbi:AAA family ATPase [Amycolatopsis rhizosphaerae]|uniref:AAA family ATPase n=1 Tax=Amycolatopsis rhizosphaerae TaxID=2053003 RepID=A0A558BH30_9PSEU|nr:AAA family ATPase [Amycolatopsis rhizosphaerae]TVT35823.1 AAA family ATPase [Amycolatopsis rhizosphaerae]
MAGDIGTARLIGPEFAGRREESARLTGLFRVVAEGGVATVVVGGEAGVGKSRLVAEFTRGLDARVLLGGCVELGAEGLPFAPFVAALRDCAGEVPDESRRSLAPVLPVLGPPETGEDARWGLFEGVLALLGGMAAARPVVLVVEDAHWADASSLDLIEFLVRNQSAVPGSMIMVTHRTEETRRGQPLRRLLTGLDRVPWTTRLPLGRLGRRAVVSQLRGILGREPDPLVAQEIHRRSEGNPLFVEALAETGTDGVPSSLEDLLLSTVDRLAPDPARLVRVAAVASGPVRDDTLGLVTGFGVDRLSVALRAAVDAGVLTVAGDAYVFRHALIGEAVYHGLLPGERVDLHARYAKALEDDESALAGLAHHRYEARDFPGALTAAFAAARAARKALAYTEQFQLLERVLQLWEVVPDSASLLGIDHLTLLEHTVEVALRAGEHARGERLATAALSETDQSEGVRVAVLLEQRARLRSQLGLPEALEDHRAAVRTAPDGHPARPYLLNSLAARLMDVPDPEAREVAQEALTAARRAHDEVAEVPALITLAVLDARLGDLDAQLPRLARARALAEGMNTPRLRLRALHAESSLLQAFGRLDAAISTARAGLAVARETGLARGCGHEHAIDLVGALISSGDWDEALESAEHALELAPPPTHLAHLLCLKGFLALQRGDLDAAAASLHRARELAGEGGTFTQGPLFLARLEADLALAGDRPEEAREVVRQALTSPFILVSNRFTWPLLVLGARAGFTEPMPEPRVAGPVQRAWSLTFEAERSRSRAAWAEAVDAWEELGQPLRIAQAQYGLAEAALGAGDREAAETAIRRAAGLTELLGARLLGDRLADLARRARIPVTSKPVPRFGLTPRESEILRLVADGLGNREIAERLFISAKTASVHVSNILGKLGVSNRVAAAATARRLGLVP